MCQKGHSECVKSDTLDNRPEWRDDRLVFQGTIEPPRFKPHRHKAKHVKLSLVAMYEREKVRLRKEARTKRRPC